LVLFVHATALVRFRLIAPTRKTKAVIITSQIMSEDGEPQIDPGQRSRSPKSLWYSLNWSGKPSSAIASNLGGLCVSVESDIKGAVRAALQSEPRIGTSFSLDRVAFTEDGSLIVEGEVESVAAKKLSLERIGALSGVDLIIDRLHVRPAQKMGDADIRAHLRNAFVQEPSFAALEITELKGAARQHMSSPPEPIGNLDYAVDDGIVTLNGSAPGLSTKRLAGVLAWWVPGSRDVINGMAVAESEADSPQSIEEGTASCG
jgi:osmotically-inducible protein OsmY